VADNLTTLAAYIDLFDSLVYLTHRRDEIVDVPKEKEDIDENSFTKSIFRSITVLSLGKQPLELRQESLLEIETKLQLVALPPK
jgi:hypothetical protein